MEIAFTVDLRKLLSPAELKRFMAEARAHNRTLQEHFAVTYREYLERSDRGTKPSR